MHTIRVDITYRDNKKESFDCTDYPSVGDWITLYQGLKRTCFPGQTVHRIEYDVAKRRK